MSSKPVKLSAGRALSPGAIALMLMLCLSWGFNQIAVKLVLADVPPMLQALIRSVGALPVLLAIGVPQTNVDATVLLGDLLIVAGGALWATTTLIVKTTALIKAPAEKGLGYQVALSIPILALAAWISGETITHVPGPLSLSLLAYQTFWVVGLTFLLWFALVKTYSASKLSAFTFVTPLFGVAASYFILHDTLTIAFGVAALLVIAGLYLVNKPDPKVVPDPNLPA